jgi:pimeloyl-ACP methyl ester carboxylesterase
MSVTPFQIKVPQTVLDDLQDRLARTRWTGEVEGVGWDYGTNVGYMKELVNYWRHQYDWRKQEATINTFHWLKADIDGKEIRFIHERGKGPNPTPIILFHGWPDSFLRYTKVIPMLTDPAKYGGDSHDSFDVIVPHLIDRSEGGKVQVRKHRFKQTAEHAWKLMTELGYKRFAAGGGDGGSPLSQLLAVHHTESIIGLHLTDIGYDAMRAQHTDLSETEKAYLSTLQKKVFQETAYAMLQGTKPQTLAFSLNDSPVGLAAWIIEKIRTWSDCDGDVETLFTKDELLTNIMLYWVEGFDPRGYREEWVMPSLAPDQQIDVPVGLAQSPKDLNPPVPREFAERNLKNLQRFTILDHGGHFAAMEFPELYAKDVREAFRQIRKESVAP